MSQIRHYETTFILRPDIDEADRNAIVERIEKIITDGGGEIVRTEDWGRRKLAYEVKDETRGIYVYIRYVAPGDVNKELERVMRLLDNVIKFLTIKVDPRFEEEVRQAKARQAEREASGYTRDDDDDDDDNDDD